MGVKRKYESIRKNFKDKDNAKSDGYGKKARYDWRKQRVCIGLYSVFFLLKAYINAVLPKNWVKYSDRELS